MVLLTVGKWTDKSKLCITVEEEMWEKDFVLGFWNTVRSFWEEKDNKQRACVRNCLLHTQPAFPPLSLVEEAWAQPKDCICQLGSGYGPETNFTLMRGKQKSVRWERMLFQRSWFSWESYAFLFFTYLFICLFSLFLLPLIQFAQNVEVTAVLFINFLGKMWPWVLKPNAKNNGL